MSASVKTAGDIIALQFESGLSSEEVVSRYDAMGQDGTYEKVNDPEYWTGPSITTAVVDKFYHENKDISILDIAAGSGLVGKELNTHGYTNLHALDPSSGMLSLAKDKGIYNKLFCTTLDKHEISELYDCVVCCGTMGLTGHIPKEGLFDMARMTKPGGRVVVVMREEYMETFYHGDLETYISDMESRGVWCKEDQTVHNNYFYDKNGLSFALKVQ